MTQEQFIAKFRGRMLLFVSEAWAIRKENTTSLGMLMDGHNIEALRLMNEMYESLTAKTLAAPAKPTAAVTAAPQRSNGYATGTNGTARN